MDRQEMQLMLREQKYIIEGYRKDREQLEQRQSKLEDEALVCREEER